MAQALALIFTIVLGSGQPDPLINMFIVLRGGDTVDMKIERPACEKLHEALSEGATVNFLVKETGQSGEAIMIICRPDDALE